MDYSKEIKQNALTAEYSAKLTQSDACLDELHAKDRVIERHLDDIYDFRTKLMAELEYWRSELVQKNAQEDIQIIHEIEGTLNQDIHRTNRALLDERDVVVRERNRVLSEKDDIESEYQRAKFALDEEADKFEH